MSPMASMVGRAVLDWDVEISFPQPRTDDDLAVGLAALDTRFTSSAALSRDRTSTRGMIESTAVVGTGAGLYIGGIGGAPGGVPVIRAQAGVLGDSMHYGLEGIRGTLDTASLINLPAGAAWPSMFRVWWLRALVRYQDDGGGAAGIGSGMLVLPQDGPFHAWPTQIVGVNNRGGFGIVGDAAGAWAYQSFDRTGIGLVRETVALPAHTIGDFNLVEWVIVGARPGINAYAEFWFNSTLVASRNWLGGLLEPIGGAVPANTNEWQWVPHVQVTNQAGVYLTGGVMRAGRFLRDGTEIQG